MTAQVDAKQVLNTYVAALQADDEEAIRESLAEDASWTLDAGELPISGTWVGRDRIVDEFLAGALRYYEPGSISFEVTSMTAEDDRVVMQWTTHARTRSGRPYDNGCIGVFTIKDAKIQTVREYMDTLYAYERAFAPDPSAARSPDTSTPRGETR